MKKSTCMFILLLAGSNLFAQSSQLDGIDTFVNRVLKEWKAVGVSVTIVEKNKVLMSKGYGIPGNTTKMKTTRVWKEI